jgi:hypothetical protein
MRVAANPDQASIHHAMDAVNEARDAVEQAKQKVTSAEKLLALGRDIVDDWRHDNMSLAFLPEASAELNLALALHHPPASPPGHPPSPSGPSSTLHLSNAWHRRILIIAVSKP